MLSILLGLVFQRPFKIITAADLFDVERLVLERVCSPQRMTLMAISFRYFITDDLHILQSVENKLL